MLRRSPLVYVDVDLTNPHPTSIIRCQISAKLASFCCTFERQDWRRRKAFIKFVHDSLSSNEMGIAILAKVVAQPDEAWIDYQWDRRVGQLVKEGLYLEHTMWTLSTYGGAVSAMADFMDKFAHKALSVSLKQREVALRLDSSILLSRCNMYIGLALAQMGHFAQAIRIIKKEFNNAKNLQSEFLMNCARGLWVKVVYMRKKAVETRSERRHKLKEMT